MSLDVVLEKIIKYRHFLDRALGKNSDQQILVVLDKLDRLPINLDHLQETGIGKTVNSYRKCSDPVGQRAKSIVNKWKGLIHTAKAAEEYQKSDGSPMTDRGYELNASNNNTGVSDQVAGVTHKILESNDSKKRKSENDLHSAQAKRFHGVPKGEDYKTDSQQKMLRPNGTPKDSACNDLSEGDSFHKSERKFIPEQKSNRVATSTDVKSTHKHAKGQGSEYKDTKCSNSSKEGTSNSSSHLKRDASQIHSDDSQKSFRDSASKYIKNKGSSGRPASENELSKSYSSGKSSDSQSSKKRKHDDAEDFDMETARQLLESSPSSQNSELNVLALPQNEQIDSAEFSKKGGKPSPMQLSNDDSMLKLSSHTESSSMRHSSAGEKISSKQSSCKDKLVSGKESVSCGETLQKLTSQLTTNKLSSQNDLLHKDSSSKHSSHRVSSSKHSSHGDSSRNHSSHRDSKTEHSSQKVSSSKQSSQKELGSHSSQKESSDKKRSSDKNSLKEDSLKKDSLQRDSSGKCSSQKVSSNKPDSVQNDKNSSRSSSVVRTNDESKSRKSVTVIKPEECEDEDNCGKSFEDLLNYNTAAEAKQASNKIQKSKSSLVSSGLSSRELNKAKESSRDEKQGRSSSKSHHDKKVKDSRSLEEKIQGYPKNKSDKTAKDKSLGSDDEDFGNNGMSFEDFLNAPVSHSQKKISASSSKLDSKTKSERKASPNEISKPKDKDTSQSLLPLPLLKDEDLSLDSDMQMYPSVQHSLTIKKDVEKPVTLERRYCQKVIYSGRVKEPLIPVAMKSLFDACIRVLQENVDCITVVGGVPGDLLKPVLEVCSAEHLYRLEYYNPHFVSDTDSIWMMHCNRDFRGKETDEFESWRELYLRLQDDRKAKLANISKSVMAKKNLDDSLVSRTRLTYIDNNPANRRRQNRPFSITTGADNSDEPAQPRSRQEILDSMKHQIANPIPRRRGGAKPEQRVVARTTSAPLMQKTLKFMKMLKR